MWYPIFYHADHMLIVHVRRETGIYHLVLYDLGIFQVPLGVLKNLKISAFRFVPLFVVNFNR